MYTEYCKNCKGNTEHSQERTADAISIEGYNKQTYLDVNVCFCMVCLEVKDENTFVD